jgi:hypothetical protein
MQQPTKRTEFERLGIHLKSRQRYLCAATFPDWARDEVARLRLIASMSGPAFNRAALHYRGT